MKHALACRSFRPFAKNTLIGFAEIHIPALRLTILDVALHRLGDKRWAALPAKPMLRDGRQTVDEATGKPAYAKILEFDDRATRDAFSAAVWRAVAERHPEVAEPAEAAP